MRNEDLLFGVLGLLLGAKAMHSLRLRAQEHYRRGKLDATIEIRDAESGKPLPITRNFVPRAEPDRGPGA